MKSTLAEFITKIQHHSSSITFEEVMNAIKEYYDYTPADFNNGELTNEAGTNEGSCKIFYFAQLNSLSVEQTLACFGRFYFEDVLQNPEGNDHGNIRNFIVHGWQGIKFKTTALVAKG
jgi:hypothetical protein